MVWSCGRISEENGIASHHLSDRMSRIAPEFVFGMN